MNGVCVSPQRGGLIHVLAADYALYQQAFGVGGRYYGDTLPTDPSTIP